MSCPQTDYQRIRRALALGGVAFAVCVAVSMIANDAPATATASQVANAAMLALVLAGWLAPVLSLAVLAYSLCRMLGNWRKAEGGVGEGVEAAMIGLGSLILVLTTSWGYLAFGLCRMGGNPPMADMWLTLSLLVGGSGLLLLQRWAGVLVCSAGWWWLWYLVEMRAKFPADPSRWNVASLLAAPMSAAVIASWRYLRNGL